VRAFPPPRWPGGAARAAQGLRSSNANRVCGQAWQFGELLGRRKRAGIEATGSDGNGGRWSRRRAPSIL
jgi:hypothetical protein